MPVIEDEQKNQNPNPTTETPRKQRRPSMPELLTKLNQLNHHHNHQNQTHQNQNPTEKEKEKEKEKDPFSLLTDKTLTKILSYLPITQHVSNALVCKRFLTLQGTLLHSLSVLDWEFLSSGRLLTRFPNLTHINLAPGTFLGSDTSGVFLSNKLFTLQVNLDVEGKGGWVVGEKGVLGSERVDKGLEVVSKGYPNLRRLVIVNASEVGLRCVGERCEILQELELHCVRDESLVGVKSFKNLQIVKLVGGVEGVYGGRGGGNVTVTDIGLTMLAQGCRRLVKLELSGCEGSYDGVKAIGQCCIMLEELIIGGCRMDGGWLSGLAYCGNLKTLRIVGCEDGIDKCPGRDEHLGSCGMIEELYLERCQVRDKESVRALFLVCEAVREVSVKDCWGLEDDVFRYGVILRRVRSLSLEGCSLLTIEGLDSVVHTWKELETLRVVSCNNIKDSEITPELATLFSVLKELKWRPDSKSLLSSSLAGTGVRKKGGRFFKRV